MKPIIHTRQQPEMSQLQRQLLGQEHVKFYTQEEFDASMAFAKAEIMTVAIQTTKQALLIEREACAELARKDGHDELAEKILNRIPSQRQ
jgi:hypothetical protein